MGLFSLKLIVSIICFIILGLFTLLNISVYQNTKQITSLEILPELFFLILGIGIWFI